MFAVRYVRDCGCFALCRLFFVGWSFAWFTLFLDWACILLLLLGFASMFACALFFGKLFDKCVYVDCRLGAFACCVSTLWHFLSCMLVI